MKFKSKEDLVKDIQKNHRSDYAKLIIDEGVNKIFDSFEERIKFYKKYSLLFNENGFPELKETESKLYKNFVDKMEKSCKNIKGLNGITTEQLGKIVQEYEKWLFEHCFSDVIE